MAGNVLGGKKAAIANKTRHGEDFYKVIGKRGGSVTGVKKGFALNRELASRAGRIGGLNSSRKGVPNEPKVTA